MLVVCASEDPAYALCDPPVSTLSPAPDMSMPTAVTALVGLIETPGRVHAPTEVPIRRTSHARPGRPYRAARHRRSTSRYR
ncbi:hypothetical protein [Streptomyces scabiei]|uniref:hypothetical protein n=1 Tax=Streptomyces scabiei TaxID=1930 RepID=UPI003F76577F